MFPRSSRGGIAAAVLMFLASIACNGCQTGAFQRREGGARHQGSTAVQALIGATEFRNLEFERSAPNDPNTRATADVSTMPALGFAGQYAVGGNGIEFGFDGGLLFSWDADSSIVSTGGGTAVIVSDMSMLLVDLFFGGYASAILGDKIRVYGGVGPSLMWGDADYRNELVDESESAFGVGYYLRTGAEFRLADHSFIGLGVRWVDTTLDFGGQIGDVDAEGIQAFLTYTQGF